MATDKVPLARSASTTAYSATMAEIATWANTNLPVASTTVSGTVKVDGSSITIASGVISSAAAPPASTSPPAMDGTANAGVLNQWSRGDHIHPSDTSRVTQAQGDVRWLQLSGGTTTGPVALASGSTTTTVTPASDSTTKLATTAFVQSALGAAGAGVSSWNTRAGAVTLQQSDLAALNVYDDAGRNLIHNATFTVQQRGTGPFTANGYTVDRWVASIGASDTISVVIGSAADADRAAIGNEAVKFFLQYQFTGSAAANSFVTFNQNMESVLRFSGKQCTLSFYAKTTSGSTRIAITNTQSFGTGGSPSGNVSSVIGTTPTLTTTWTRYSFTFTFPSAAGKTFGTTAGTDYTQIGFWLSDQPNWSGSGIGVQSGVTLFWGVQLEVGSVATPLDYGGSPQQQLAQCQRFFIGSQQQIQFVFNSAGGGVPYLRPVAFPVTMRATPTIAMGGNSGNTNAGGQGTANASPWGFDWTVTSTAAGLTGLSAAGYTASADL